MSEKHLKIIEGLEKAYKEMVLFKRYKGTSIVVSQDGKTIEHIDPNTVDVSE